MQLSQKYPNFFPPPYQQQIDLHPQTSLPKPPHLNRQKIQNQHRQNVRRLPLRLRRPHGHAHLRAHLQRLGRAARAKITIIGNLAATPEVRPTSTGREVIEYAVASNSGPKDKRVTSWFRVASFEPEGPRRDFLTSLPKGATVYVEGNCVIKSYQDQEGQNRSSMNVYQTNIEVLRRPVQSEGEGEGQ
ncbi:primosome PriB/single-strand DNA-binding protein [Apiospora phragmitis]|uniref:Primosome PriB/single-strand DNA-binding protein n=1 Tax=Apiospora phragmitis TaxID=2905665 RepID=A0ABR1TP35_9PEZI